MTATLEIVKKERTRLKEKYNEEIVTNKKLEGMFYKILLMLQNNYFFSISFENWMIHVACESSKVSNERMLSVHWILYRKSFITGTILT